MGRMGWAPGVDWASSFLGTEICRANIHPRLSVTAPLLGAFDSFYRQIDAQRARRDPPAPHRTFFIREAAYEG